MHQPRLPGSGNYLGFLPSFFYRARIDGILYFYLCIPSGGDLVCDGLSTRLAWILEPPKIW